MKINLYMVILVLLIGIFTAGCGSSSSNTVRVISDPVPDLLAQIKYYASIKKTATTNEEGLGTITFTDMSGYEWKLTVENVEKTSETTAIITLSYNFSEDGAEEGKMTMDFSMFYDTVDNKWMIDEIKIVKYPEIAVINSDSDTSNTDTASSTEQIGIVGYVIDDSTKEPIEGASVTLYGTSYETVTDSTGYYEFIPLEPGTYTVIIARDNYTIKTIPNVTVQ